MCVFLNLSSPYFLRQVSDVIWSSQVAILAGQMSLKDASVSTISALGLLAHTCMAFYMGSGSPHVLMRPLKGFINWVSSPAHSHYFLKYVFQLNIRED